MLSVRIIVLSVLTSLAALPALADDLPPLMTSPTPDSGGTIKWNTPAPSSAPQPSTPSPSPPPPAPSAQTVTPANGTITPNNGAAAPPSAGTTLPPGTTIHWADQPGAVAVPNNAGAPPPAGAVVAPDVRWRSFVRGDVVEIADRLQGVADRALGRKGAKVLLAQVAMRITK